MDSCEICKYRGIGLKNDRNICRLCDSVYLWPSLNCVLPRVIQRNKMIKILDNIHTNILTKLPLNDDVRSKIKEFLILPCWKQ